MPNCIAIPVSVSEAASQPEELVERAHQLGYSALALTDDGSVAGVVRAHAAAQRLGLQLLPGAALRVADEATLVVLPRDLDGWGQLCQCITVARRAAPKGHYRLAWSNVDRGQLSGCEVVLSLPDTLFMERATALARALRTVYDGHLWLAQTSGLQAADALRTHRLRQLAGLTGLPLVATGQV